MMCCQVIKLIIRQVMDIESLKRNFLFGQIVNLVLP